VILYGDNTWQYYKTPEYQKTTGVLDEYWSSVGANPYAIELSDMPAQWSIWCVDSLDQYHCPYQGEVYYRGKFGMRRGRRHQGVDLPLKKGDPIYATFTGKVRISKYWGAYGNVVVIRHENGIETFYAHLSERLVEAEQWVNAGEVIGYGGSTGRSTGPHLHFETRYKGFAFDPQWLIDFKTGELRHRLFVLKKKYFNIYSNYEQDFDDEAKNEEEDKKEDAEREAMRWYTIKSGDTLGAIAIRNNTTVKELCRLNGITTKTVLKIGRKIRVR
jgi:murein DD-endopeptidase MepM/ murein hydrolase activator NlpD